MREARTRSAYENVGELHRAGVPTATHAIGDAAVRHVLDTVAKARTTGRAVRHRVEHVETVPDDTLRRFAELGVIASMQPTHCCDFTRADHTDNLSRRLGEERASRAWRCRDLWDSGATVALGSDWPIAPYPPLTVMAGARHRRPTRDVTRPPHGPGRALTAHGALQAMTVNAAYAAGEGDGVGRISVGHRADLTVFADSPLTAAARDLAELPVVLTVLDGRPTHRDAALQALSPHQLNSRSLSASGRHYRIWVSSASASSLMSTPDSGVPSSSTGRQRKPAAAKPSAHGGGSTKPDSGCPGTGSAPAKAMTARCAWHRTAQASARVVTVTAWKLDAPERAPSSTRPPIRRAASQQAR